jgi:hypothetical protein
MIISNLYIYYLKNLPFCILGALAEDKKFVPFVKIFNILNKS